MTPSHTIRIIGIGNLFSGDDAVGIFLARQLRDQAMEGVEVIEAQSPGLDILDLLSGTDIVILIDALRSGEDPGSVIRLGIPRDLDRVSLMTWDSNTSSSHTLGLGEALMLGHTLGTLPSTLVIYGIELGHITLGKALSSQVLDGIEALVPQLVKDIQGLQCTSFN